MKVKSKYILTVAVILIGVLAVILSMLLFSGRTPHTAVLKVPQDATRQMVYDTLAKAYGGVYAKKTLSMASMMGFEIERHPGNYEFKSGTPRWKIALYMGKGRQTPVRFTINNLRTRNDIAKSIASHFDFTAQQFDSVLTRSDLLRVYNLTPADANALFINNTFEAWWTDTPEKVIKRIGDAYLAFWTDKRQQQVAALGLTPAQVITIASIAEEETTHSDERGRIGRLYINRLAKGMRLQADPTVRFAVNDFTVRRIGRDMLWVESPYNTYRVGGLPPGPIRTVEAATIDAILHSDPSDDLYMCARADFSGYHKFASDYAEHQHNALEYRAALDARGIK